MKKYIVLIALLVPMFAQASVSRVAFRCYSQEDRRLLHIEINDGTAMSWGGRGYNLFAVEDIQGLKVNEKSAVLFQGLGYHQVLVPLDFLSGKLSAGVIRSNGHSDSSNFTCEQISAIQN